MTGRERMHLTNVEHDGVVECDVEMLEVWLRREERAAVQLDDRLHVRRPRRLRSRCSCHELVVRAGERVIEAPLEADRRRSLRAHRSAAQGAGDMARIHLDAVTKLDEALQRMEEALGAVERLDRQVRSRGVTDEERVAG